MHRKLVLLIALAALGSLVFGAIPADAATAINGTGSIGTCPSITQIGIKPALVNGGTSPTALKVQTKGVKGGVCTGTRTGDGANVIAGQSKGTATGTSNDCTALIGTQPSNLTLTVKWKSAKGTPKLNPSTIAITSQTGGVAGDGHGTFDATGTVTAGSFMGDTVTSHLETDQSVTEILAACDTTTGGKGVKKITSGVKASKSDSVIGSGTTTIS